MKTSMRPLLPMLVLSCSVIAQAPFAQQSGTPTFRANTNLVQLSVVVTEHGRHVGGLKREQFAVLEDGAPQTIAAFEEIDAAGPAPAPSRVNQPGVYSNAVSGERSGRVTVILLDLLNTTPAKQEHARTGFIRFLASLGETREPMMMAVLNGSGLHVVHDFTTNTAVLLAAVKRVRRQFDPHADDAGHAVSDLNDSINSIDALPGTAAEVAVMRSLIEKQEDLRTLQIYERTQLTLDSLNQLALALAGVPGHKALIWSTEGVSYLATPADAVMAGRRQSVMTSPIGVGIGEVTALNNRFQQVWKQLSSANVAVYPVDLAEVENPAFASPDYRLSGDQPFQVSGGINKVMAMSGFAEQTGGHYCELQTHMENCFRSVVDDASRYYLASYYASSRGKPGWRKTHVKVSAPGVSVRTRSGYFAGDPAEPNDQRRREVAEALAAPIDYTAVPLTFRWLADVNGGKRVFTILIHPGSFSFDGDRQNHFRLTLVAAGHKPAGEISGALDLTVQDSVSPEALEKIQQTGILYRGQVEIPPGAEFMRFVVRDEVSGRMGSVTANLPSLATSH